jgi:hypothetical protein
MNFQQIKPLPALEGFVHRIFIINGTGRLPNEDLKLIVPNACAKLVIPFSNSLQAKSASCNHISKENKIAFISISDCPAIVDYQHDAPSGNITIEFSPLGAYRFFNINWVEVKNSIQDCTSIFPGPVTCLEEELINETDIREKVGIIQRFLVNELIKSDDDPIFDFCVQQIMLSKGTVAIKRLEQYTGYSTRWLNIKFHNRLGLSPKNLSSVIRFQQYYQSLQSKQEFFFLGKEFYNYFYDQSHFIKDFKRFTGYSPTFFSKSNNEYDKFFYKM